MFLALAILIPVLCLLVGAVVGVRLSRRRIHDAGWAAAIRELVLAEDHVYWVAAHYLETEIAAKAFSEAPTVRMTKRATAAVDLSNKPKARA